MTNELEYYKRLTEKYKADSLQLVKENKELEQKIYELKTRIDCILQPKKEYYIIDDNSIKYLGKTMSWRELCDTLNYYLNKLEELDQELKHICRKKKKEQGIT